MLHETLATAVTVGIESLKIDGAKFCEVQARKPFEFGGIPYPQQGANGLPYKESHFELESFKGKGTKKYGHLTIWRHESGRYEVNAYSA